MVTLVAGRATPVVPVESAGATEGRVVVVGGTDSVSSTVFVLVDESVRGVLDGRVDRVFRLDVRRGTVDALMREFAHAKVRWEPGRASIVGPGDDELVLTLDTLASGVESGQISGYGLSQTRGWNMSLARRLTRASVVELRAELLRRQAGCTPQTCNSGGQGSSSCVVAGCSNPPTGCGITCNPGYTPCCGCASSGESCCRCLTNPPPDQ